MLKMHDERGQSLVQLALMMVVLLGFAALAIDMGYRYVERRRMQNAADAAALAGAYALCQNVPATSARATAVAYLTRNGVKPADIGTDDVKVSGGKVDVHADIVPLTFLAGAVGASWGGGVVVPTATPPAQIGANAGATCGAATSTCGLFPVAFEKALYVNAACGARMVIWDADKDDIDSACEIGGVTHPFCDCYDCSDNDGPLTLFTDTSRGWLDFTGSTDPLYPDTCASNGCGDSELKCRIEKGAAEMVTLPACIAGLRGVKAGASKEIDARAGDIVRLPLYDTTCSPVGNHCSGTDAEGYHVVDFGCVQVEGWVQSLQLDPKPGMDKSYKKIKSKAIIVTKVCGGACATSCGSTNGALPETWQLRAVSITK